MEGGTTKIKPTAVMGARQIGAGGPAAAQNEFITIGVGGVTGVHDAADAAI